MKIKCLLIVALIALFASTKFAQSAVITPRKVTYKRPKPITDYKKSFTVTYPKVKGVSPTIAKKIENTLSYERVFNFTIKEEIGEIQWLEDAAYEVDYNKRGILGVSLMIEGSGAYPDGVQKPIIINLKTGQKITPQDVFVNLNGLVAKLKGIQQKEVKDSIVEIKKQDPETENPSQLFEDTKYTLKDLNEFSINDKGITFWYDYGFPHVIQALQPEGRYFLNWTELKPFIKQGGLLAQFVR